MIERRPALGKGLSALIPDTPEPPRQGVMEVDIDLLAPSDQQPRLQLDDAKLTELADSIRVNGVIQPILVRRTGSTYRIIAGERRWRAAQRAGLMKVPVVVRDVPEGSEKQLLELALVENIQRENLNPLEEAFGIQRLIDEFNMTHEKAADAVGRSRSAVSNLLRLLNLAAPVQDLLVSEKIDMGHARALLSLPGAKQIQLGQEIAAKNLTVREAEKLVKRQLNPKTHSIKIEDRDVLRLQEELADKLGVKVTLKASQKGKGRLIIDFESLEQLNSVIQRIS